MWRRKNNEEPEVRYRNIKEDQFKERMLQANWVPRYAGQMLSDEPEVTFALRETKSGITDSGEIKQYTVEKTYTEIGPRFKIRESEYDGALWGLIVREAYLNIAGEAESISRPAHFELWETAQIWVPEDHV